MEKKEEKEGDSAKMERGAKGVGQRGKELETGRMVDAKTERGGKVEKGVKKNKNERE